MNYYVIFSQEYGGYIKNYTHIVDFKCEPRGTRKERFTGDFNKAQLYTNRRDLHNIQGRIPSCYGIPVEIHTLIEKSFS